MGRCASQPLRGRRPAGGMVPESGCAACAGPGTPASAWWLRLDKRAGQSMVDAMHHGVVRCFAVDWRSCPHICAVRGVRRASRCSKVKSVWRPGVMRHDGDRRTRFARSGELASLFKHGALAIGIPTRTARGESIGLRSAGSFAERLERLDSRASADGSACADFHHRRAARRHGKPSPQNDAARSRR